MPGLLGAHAESGVNKPLVSAGLLTLPYGGVSSTCEGPPAQCGGKSAVLGRAAVGRALWIGLYGLDRRDLLSIRKGFQGRRGGLG